MGKISWSKNVDPEKEDRDKFLALSDSEKFDFLMKLIFNNQKTGKPTWVKKTIKWT